MALKDFLRNIVNPHLGRAIREGKIQANTVDEVRRLISQAESRYGFSVYGGNPEKLLDYFNSKDFELLVSAFKGGNALEVLVGILREVAEEYRDLPEVRARALDMAQRLSVGEPVKSELAELFERVKSMFSNYEASLAGDEVLLRVSQDFVVRISYEGGRIRVVQCRTTFLDKRDVERLREVVAGG